MELLKIERADVYERNFERPHFVPRLFQSDVITDLCEQQDRVEVTRVRLTERERDKLLIFTAAEVARRRKERGLKLNHPEAVALITAEVLEGVRDGKSVSELMSYGATILACDDVMAGVPEMIPDIQIEGTFPDGTKLVTIHDPIR